MTLVTRVAARYSASEKDFPREVLERIKHIVQAMGVKSFRTDIKKVPRGWKFYLAIDTPLFASGGPIATGSDFGQANSFNLPSNTRAALRALFLTLAHSGTARQLGPEVEPVKMVNVNAVDIDGKEVEFTILGNYE